MPDFVIVGAGECGARAAFALRERGFDGTITMVGAERYLPYERPPLSKATLLEAAAPRLLADFGRYRAAGIAISPGVAAESVDREARCVVLADGRSIPFDKLLLATGARPRALPGVPFSGRRVLGLRNHDDALAIRPHLGPGRHVAIAGGGFIGMELAASARKSGARVTVLVAAPRILMRGIPEPIARVLEERHIAEGVEIHRDINVDAVSELEGGVLTRLSDGREIASDVLVVGIGAVPNTALAEACGLAVEDDAKEVALTAAWEVRTHPGLIDALGAFIVFGGDGVAVGTFAGVAHVDGQGEGRDALAAGFRAAGEQREGEEGRGGQ